MLYSLSKINSLAIGCSIFIAMGFLACKSDKQESQPASNHEQHNTGKPKEGSPKPLNLSGHWTGWIYSKANGTSRSVFLEKSATTTAKMAEPKDKSTDSKIWSIHFELSQKDNGLSGSCTLELMNQENKQDLLEGKVTGKIDPTKKEVSLKLDDNLGEALVANTIFLTYQDSKPETLSGELEVDTETKPEKTPEQPKPTPPVTTPSPTSKPASPPPPEPPPAHQH